MEKKQGEYIWYYESGKVESKANYAEGIQQGEYITYYESGEIKETKNFKDGVLIED